MRNRRRLPGVFAFSVGTIALLAGTSPARAQWGMGWGWGGFGVHPSASTNMVNQHALNRALRHGESSDLAQGVLERLKRVFQSRSG